MLLTLKKQDQLLQISLEVRKREPSVPRARSHAGQLQGQELWSHVLALSCDWYDQGHVIGTP